MAIAEQVHAVAASDELAHHPIDLLRDAAPARGENIGVDGDA